MSWFERWLGGSPLGVLLRLLFLSLVVGILFAALGLTPFGLVQRLLDMGRAVLDLGLGAVHDFGRYILTGAIIVVPLWILSRIFAARR